MTHRGGKRERDREREKEAEREREGERERDTERGRERIKRASERERERERERSMPGRIKDISVPDISTGVLVEVYCTKTPVEMSGQDCTGSRIAIAA